LAEVGSADRVTKVEKYLCDATHADTAYSNKMDAFDLSPHSVSSVAVLHFLA
jgi:hypothetical protein